MLLLLGLVFVLFHLIALSINGDNVAYFDTFGAEHILKEFKKFISNKIY